MDHLLLYRCKGSGGECAIINSRAAGITVRCVLQVIFSRLTVILHSMVVLLSRPGATQPSVGVTAGITAEKIL